MTDQFHEPFPDAGLASADVDVNDDFEDGVTSDPTMPDESGETYVPPIDPPVVPGEEGQPDMAAGFARDAYPDADDPDLGRPTTALADDDVAERIRERLAADALGSEYAEQLGIVNAGGVVTVAGIVEDLDVQDHILGLVAAVPGVRDVRDRLLPE